MADTAASPAPAPSPKKAKAAKPKKPRTTPNHPKVSEMVNAAITNLKERGGSSLQAIKKYIAGNYKVDVEKLAPFIKRYLKTAVTNGTLIQTKGKGASGSFKLSASTGKPKEKKVKKATKPVSEKKAAKPKKPAKKAKPKKADKKKSAEKPKKAAEKKLAKPKKTKSPKKEKKAKSPKKPKSPKPKKAAAKKATKK